MAPLFLVGYDDSPSSRRAVDFAVDQAKQLSGSIVIAHVLEWSPYSFLTPAELEERHKRRKEELARAETAVTQPIVEKLKNQGLTVDAELRYGNVPSVIDDLARERNATQIVIGRTGNAGVVSRVFGSVAGALAQNASVPCTIIP